MTFKNYSIESTIKDLQSQENLFLMIVGGSGSGKNYIYNKHFSNIPLEDVDEYVMNWSNGNHEAGRKMVSKAIAEVNKQLDKAFKAKESIGITGTGASLAGTLNRLIKAKEHGMKTAIILVDVSVKTAIERVQLRTNNEGRSSIPDYKIERTNKSARENFKEFKKIADYSLRIKN